MNVGRPLDPGNTVSARVYFKKTEDGGRNGPTPKGKLHCIFVHRDNNYDCRLYFGTDHAIAPGESADVTISFIDPSNVIPKLRAQDTFELRDYRHFATGRIINIGLQKTDAG
jgi:hypothetical protein